MQNIKDRFNRDWTIELSLYEVDHIKKATGIDLMDPETIQELAFLKDFSAVAKLGQVLWLLCESQAERAKLSPEDFARGFKGEQIERAMLVLEQELLDLLAPRQREPMATLFAKVHEAKEVMLKAAKTRIEAIQFTDADANAALDQLVEMARDENGVEKPAA